MANGSAKPTGLVTRKYKSGSIIYFSGDKSESIYILKSGRVLLTSVKLDTGSEVKEEVRLGEFFGVKSALGKYPREETAQTIGETVVLIFGLADFERLILRNVNVVRKMLRVFSNQLRRIGKMVRSVMGESENLNPDIELFRIGEHYYKVGIFQQAQYAFKRYMEYYPDGEYAKTAMDRIKAIDSGEAIPGDTGFDMDFDEQADQPVEDELGDFVAGGEEQDDLISFDGESDDLFNTDSGDGDSNLSDEMDDFLSDSGGFDDLLSSEEGGSSDKFSEATKQFEDGKFEESYNLYSDIVNSGNAGENELEESHIGMGRSQLMRKKYKEAIEIFSNFMKKFPNSSNVKKSLFYIGSVFESVNKNDKAIAYYKKVASMQPGDSLSKQATEKLDQLQNI